MINVKFVVLLIYINALRTCRCEYCERSPEHTLCKYSKSGPSDACKGYDKTALLTQDDVNNIVNRINERRNFVAMGLSRSLPPAADMKKIAWSEELAMFAQRCVDKCEPSVHPDKEDQCRNLADAEVGQNVATILGASPGHSVKSFVEMWYMQISQYKGSISYYNQSQDQETNYFTQLIWAKTNIVGCGKARFQVGKNNMIIERLVCNFAPKGNVHGRPVYAIGFAGTQCQENDTPDRKYEGLCSNEIQTIKPTSQSPPVSSLLRILNLSNNSARQEIDPTRNNLKEINVHSNETNDHRYQKTRHVTFNKTHDAMEHFAKLEERISFDTTRNIPRNRNEQHYHQQQKEYTNFYHKQDHVNNLESRYRTDQERKMQDYPTESLLNINSKSDSNYRRLYQNKKCTRKLIITESKFRSKKCTRGRNKQSTQSIHSTMQPQKTTISDKYHIMPHNLCSCNIERSTCTTTHAPCTCNTNCQCLSDRYNNDLYPSAGIQRSHVVNKKSVDENLSPSLKIYDPVGFIQLYNLTNKSGNNSEHSRFENKTGYNISAHLRKHYVNHILTRANERLKRDNGDQIEFKSFWNTKDYMYKNPSQTRFLKYTTLSNKKNKRTRTTPTSIKMPLSTESITITFKDITTHKNHHRPMTEKFLSFEELMHLRKFENLDYDFRRKADEALRDATKETNLPSKETTEITTNTPFVRQKHCTRKVTCTWTAPTVTDEGGKIINAGGNQGSKTPPGYVEGCTRTSTCTRDFMHRNKMPLLSDVTTLEPTPEDEDYCERRSLDLRRRNFNDDRTTFQSISYEEVYTENPMLTSHFIDDQPNEEKTAFKTQNNCVCTDQKRLRVKRTYNNNNQILVLSNDNNKSSKTYLTKNRFMLRQPFCSYNSSHIVRNFEILVITLLFLCT